MTPLDRHERIALSFSGGKDSLCVAHMLRPQWDRITFYHVDAGDLLPEVMAIVADMEKMVPRFVRIESNSRAWIKANGLPADLVPHTGTPEGQWFGSLQKITSRYNCCASNLWLPLHNRLVEDKITLVIRGTKRVDMPSLPDTQRGPYEVYMPILDWTNEEVFSYLHAIGAPVSKLYDYTENSPECATCSAWHAEKRAAYLRKFHPELFKEYASKLQRVAMEIQPIHAQLVAELQEMV
jgi:phosphoadenosine phosphosulfate reductase